MSAVFQDEGWIRVPYDGPELAVIEIGFGEPEPGAWQPAFLHTVGDRRYAQIRPPVFFAQAPLVWLRVNNVPLLIGRLGEVETVSHRRRRR